MKSFRQVYWSKSSQTDPVFQCSIDFPKDVYAMFFSDILATHSLEGFFLLFQSQNTSQDMQACQSRNFLIRPRNIGPWYYDGDRRREGEVQMIVEN